jgi:hypothetical protein
MGSSVTGARVGSDGKGVALAVTGFGDVGIEVCSPQAVSSKTNKAKRRMLAGGFIYGGWFNKIV